MLFWVAIFCGPGTQSLQAQDPSIVHRLRMVWGGGQADNWQVTFTIPEGRFENVTPLGLQSDSGATIQVEPQQITINTLRATEFNGLDIDLQDVHSRRLTMQMIGNSGNSQPVTRTFDLTPLVDSADSNSIQLLLDESGNRFDMNRAPGDYIPITIDREHLVFDPGETFELQVRPFRGLTESASSNLIAEVVSRRDQRVVDSQEFTLRWNGTHFVLGQPVQFSVPKDEGAYQLRLTHKVDSLASRFNLSREPLSREIEFVVIHRSQDIQDASQPIVLWQEVFHSENVKKPWLERLPGLPQMRLASSSSLKNTGVTSVEKDDKTWTHFSAGGWQAVPLRVENVGKPHIVEIEYLEEPGVTMGISILQPDGAGQVEPFGVDSGIQIPESATIGEQPETKKHRIFFWPTHENPYLLFANRHDHQVAKIGSIRILSGPQRLAARSGTPTTYARRPYLSFYEKPLFAENFSAPKLVDQKTQQSIHTWDTFLTGANRWTQYLKANGFTGAMIVVCGDGSSLYPSAKLQPNPRFDSGVYSSQGSDPVRKDVVEMLLRIFQREGLTLVPVFHFNGLLPELQSLPNQEELLLTSQQDENRLTLFRQGAQSVSIYNPLNGTVRQAHQAVVEEFVERYQGQSALGGVGYLYSRDALQVLPGQIWGADQQTVDQFMTEAGIQVTAGQTPDILGEQREPWLQWREQVMGQWLGQLKEITKSVGPTYIVSGDFLQTQDAFSILAPSLRRRRSSNLQEAFQRIALPFETIKEDSELVFLQPREIAPEKSFAENRLNLQLGASADRIDTVGQAGNVGSLFTHQSSWAEFDQLRTQKLFGETLTQPVMRLQPLAPSTIWNRQRLATAMAQSDSQLLVDGGWLMNFGQEEHVSHFIEAYTKLPQSKFQDVADQGSEMQSGVVVRQSQVDGRNWFYVVNPTPWELTAQVQLSSRDTVVESLTEEPILFSLESERPVIEVHLPPFGIQAGFTDAAVNIANFRVDVPENANRELQDRLNLLLAKVSRAAQATPVEVLINPGFEAPGNGEQAPEQFEWYYDSRFANQITLQTTDPYEGQAALAMESLGDPVSIRSNEFDLPETGRLSVAVLIRTQQPESQPTLRISVQGNDGRHVYYRFGSVGGDVRKISNEWQEFAVHFDDLPLSAVGKVQVRFDLMSQGQVEIDNVRLFDRWMDAQDIKALTQLLALAGFQLTEKNNLGRCREILNGYWPRFLEQFFPDEGPLEVIADDQPPGTRASRLRIPSGKQR